MRCGGRNTIGSMAASRVGGAGALAILLLAAGVAPATLIPGSRRPTNDCLVQADISDVAGPGPRIACSDGDPCDRDGACGNTSCRFRLRVCIGQGGVPGCTPGGLRRLGARLRNGRSRLDVPLPPGLEEPGCGEFAEVEVPARTASGRTGKGAKPARLVLVATSDRGTDRDRITLRCLPRSDACPPGDRPGSGDAVTLDHPVWFAVRGDIVVDGRDDDPAWARSPAIVRTQAWRDDGAITVRGVWSPDGLWVLAVVGDRNLWADGRGGGRGESWEVETDDSFTVYVDPDESRDEYFQPTDRAFGVNLGNPADAVAGTGVVRRCKYVRGDGALGAPSVVPCGRDASEFTAATGIRWATTRSGTVNDPSDVDHGWTTELFLPWTALGVVNPEHGTTLGLNFDVIFDNDGGERNFVANNTGPDRFRLPAFVDDHVQGVYSSFTDSLSGLRGPVNYATLVLVDPGVDERPAAVADLVAEGASAYGARLRFTAPAGTVRGRGHVAAYDIRVAPAPLTGEAGLADARAVAQRYVPRRAGLPERLRIGGLEPSTAYVVAVRALDALGRAGPFSNTVTLTTTARRHPGDRGRIIPSPDGSGLEFEDGTPFVSVGEILGLGWGWYRNLFPGDIWDPVGQRFVDYRETPSFEGPVGPHLDRLRDAGVNTLRVNLERLGMDQRGNPEVPRGRYWLEFPAGTFNPDMRQFVLDLLAEAGARGIRLIFSLMDTYYWPAEFEVTPWWRGAGGPLDDLDEFFQTPGTLEMAKRRFETVLGWVRESPDAEFLLGWDGLIEWDTHWTRNAEGDGEAGRETEMRRRARWVRALQEHIRDLDPDRLVFSTATRLDPRGPVARLSFYDRSADVISPHFYSMWNEEPINAPVAHVAPYAAAEHVRRSAYWLTNRIDRRPLMNDEWGMTPHLWPGGLGVYQPGFTQADDEALFRAMTWSGVTAGQAGQARRITGDELAANYNALTPAMRDVQRALAVFATRARIAPWLGRFLPTPLVGLVAAESATATLHAWGSTDGPRGLVYVLRDANHGAGPVSDGVLRVRGLPADRALRVEVWGTAGSAETPRAALSAATAGGVLTVPLPPFDDDVMVAFVPE